jgi:hypothetical protein
LRFFKESRIETSFPVLTSQDGTGLLCASNKHRHHKGIFSTTTRSIRSRLV